MATDGVKIIDSDLAHDTYTIFLDKFERGIDIETIKTEALAEKEYFDDFDYEILITSYALALWETGHLDENTLNEVKSTLQKGASIKKWESWDKNLANQRKKVLEKFLLKISTPKKNPRKIKKFTPIQNVIFDENDTIIFKIENNYHASIITKVEKNRNYCTYSFSILDYNSPEIPTLQDIIESNIIISKIGCWESEESINQRQPGLKNIFGSLKHEFNTNFFVGLITSHTEHKKLKKFSTDFIKIGKLKIIEGYKYRSGESYDENLEQLSFSFKNYIDNFDKFKFHKIPLRKIIEDLSAENLPA